MLHRIQISTNTCEVTMQVKRAIGKATLHKLPIYNEYIRLCWVSTLFCMICCLFSNCSKSSTIWPRSLYITFSRSFVNFPRSHVPVLLAMQWSVAWRSAFYRGREHLWIVFSFKLSLFSRINLKKKKWRYIWIVPYDFYHVLATQKILYSYKRFQDKIEDRSNLHLSLIFVNTLHWRCLWFFISLSF